MLHPPLRNLDKCHSKPANAIPRAGDLKRIPLSLLCIVAHLTGYVAALTIGKDLIPFMVCAMTGLGCFVVGMLLDATKYSE